MVLIMELIIKFTKMDSSNITLYSQPKEKIVIGNEKNVYILVYAITKEKTIKIIYLKNKLYEQLYSS